MPTPEMRIPVSAVTGEASTELGAFDNALVNAGIANRNLLYLSSVIPPRTEIVKVDGMIDDIPGDWGDRLYVVHADTRTHTLGESVWAGIGWVQNPTNGEKDGRGLFVEHSGNSEDEVRTLIDESLRDLQENRQMEFEDTGTVVTGITCEDSGLAVCALAVAVYQASSWGNRAELWRADRV